MKYPAKKIFRKYGKYEYGAPRDQNMVALETLNIRGVSRSAKITKVYFKNGR